MVHVVDVHCTVQGRCEGRVEERVDAYQDSEGWSGKEWGEEVQNVEGVVPLLGGLGLATEMVELTARGALEAIVEDDDDAAGADADGEEGSVRLGWR